MSGHDDKGNELIISLGALSRALECSVSFISFLAQDAKAFRIFSTILTITWLEADQ